MSEKIALGIETSCDDTSICILQENKQDKNSFPRILAFETFSQDLLLKEWGGVVPEIASRNHNDKIVPLMKHLFDQTQLTPQQIDVIAVTTCPGLLGPLLTGINVAKTLSLLLKKPIYSVNHLTAHLEAIHLTAKINYPYLGLLVSGGHSLFVLLKSPTDLEVLGSTMDDAAGEVFDKGGKLLGLGYPAGKIIDEKAKLGNENKYKFPIGIPHEETPILSYSGLKTSLRVFIEKNPDTLTNPEKMNDVCASYQKAIVDALILKLKFAYEIALQKTGRENIPLVVGGGVACNSGLRKKFQTTNYQVHFVEPRFCTDNGAMVANLALLDQKSWLPYPESLMIDAKSRFIDKKDYN